MRTTGLSASLILLLILSVSLLTHSIRLEDIEASSYRYVDTADNIVVNFTFNLNAPTTPFPHFWEECVGSGHATLALRQDYRKYLTKVHTDTGIKMVRFHALFDDDMRNEQINVNNNISTYTTINGVAATSFFNIDSIYDFLVEIGMKPYVELSFMPDLLASGNTTVFHYEANTTPPANYADWGQLITVFVTHLVERYGLDVVRTWPFEVWNEPNCGFWDGTESEYYQFYKVTAESIKAVDPLLLVGGPATCQSQWLTSFLNFTTQYNVPVDFVSTHEYPTDISPTTRDVLTGVVQTARSQVGDLPLYYSEYNDGLYSDPSYHDTPYAAAFVAKNVHDVAPYIDLFSWWTFSDIFEEQGFTSQPFYNVDGWGLVSRYGTAKPVYRSFQLLHNLGDQLLSVFSATNSTSALAQNLEAYGTLKYTQANKRVVDIVVYNFDVPKSDMANETAIIQIVGVPTSIATTGTLNLIDRYHANAPAKWLEIGKPAYPTKAQLQEIEIASYLQPTSIPYDRISSDTIQFTLTLMPQSVAFITLDLE